MIRWILLALVKGYRYAISPLLPPSCRFHPSCSDYALTAIERHGALSGGWLAVRRVCRCHPWNAGGYDPVPPLERAGRGPRWPNALREQHGASAQHESMADTRAVTKVD